MSLAFSRAKLGPRQREQSVIAEQWARTWYKVICGLSSSYGCDARLTVLPAPIQDGDATLHGHISDDRQHITCALEEPSEVIGTLVHEVAHFAQNPRHRREHGYSFRRMMIAITEELTGVDISYEVRWLCAHNRGLCRRAALDLACVNTILRKDPRLDTWSDPLAVVARMGPRMFRVPYAELE